MAKFPLGKGTTPGNPGAGTNQAVNLDELTRRASYIVDEAGRRQAIVVEWSAWQDFVRRMGTAVGNSTPAATPPGAAPRPATGNPPHDPEYALHRDAGKVDLYRPQPASTKEAADFQLESNVTRRPRD